MVFGVFGVVVGSIFVAARAVQQQAKINQASEQLLVVVNNMKDFYANKNVAALTPSATVTFSNTTTQGFISKSIFPSDMLDTGNPATATQVLTPWNGRGHVAVFRPANQPLQMALQFTGIPLSACSAVIERNSYAGRDTGLAVMKLTYSKTTIPDGQDAEPVTANVDVTFDNSAATRSLPISAAAATALCRDADAGATMTVEWNYILANGCGVGAVPCR